MTNLRTQQHDQFNHRTAGLQTHKTYKEKGDFISDLVDETFYPLPMSKILNVTKQTLHS